MVCSIQGVNLLAVVGLVLAMKQFRTLDAYSEENNNFGLSVSETKYNY